MKELKFKFDSHGLGDVCHAAFMVQLWKQRGYEVTVQVEHNKIPAWKIAGVNIVKGGNLPNHPWGYPAGFDDLSQPDWRCNKVAHGMMHEVLPVIGSQQDLWRELCRVRLSADPIISDQVRDEARDFLKGLPRPIICLHTRGSNWQHRKSIPIETAFNLVLKLLADTGGSVVSLDFDGREPIVGHARCRGIIPSWGMISIDRLCALYEESDLMVGIDSGPFHVASFTSVKALGVFREIQPVRCCLPSPKAVYLVSRKYDHHWDSRCKEWNFRRYRNSEPTLIDIAQTALETLECGDTGRETDQLRLGELAGKYLYRRVGYDERPMILKPDGTIGLGSADCEQWWSVIVVDGKERLTISGSRSTCHLFLCEGMWCGRWIYHEQMPVELIPLCESQEANLTTSPNPST